MVEMSRDDDRLKPIERADPLVPRDAPLVRTADSLDCMSAVLADPGRAWLFERFGRKVAHAGHRGVGIPGDADDDEVDVELGRLVGDDDLVPSIWSDARWAAEDLHRTGSSHATCVRDGVRQQPSSAR
jgi:hypothetical protein